MKKSIFKISSLLMVSVMVILTIQTTGVEGTESSDTGTYSSSPVDSHDVIYQIITDRFYDGDSSNNIPDGFDSDLFDGTGDDLKLYQGGDWQGIIDKISYLKGMGVTTVWISAPYENRDDAIIDYDSDGTYDVWTSFHGYHVRNYFATNEHFGDLSEFKDLRDELHDNDMKLVIDFVTNHTSRWQNPTDDYSEEDGKLYEPDKLSSGEYAFDSDGEPYDYDGDGLVENLLVDPNDDTSGWFHGLGDRGTDTSTFAYRHYDLGSLADFSQENSEVVEYIESAVAFWTALGIDGLRHDATLHMNTAFVKGLKDAVDSTATITHFGEFFIGRPDDKYSEYIDFPTVTGVNNLDFEFYNAANTTFGDFSTTMEDFGDMLEYTADDYAYENQTVTFLDNHDVSRFGYNQNNQKPYDAAIAVLMTSRGIPNIYYGTEQYVIPDDSSDVSGRIFMETDSSFDTTTTAYQLISELSDLRQTNDAIAYGLTSILYSSDDVLVYERKFYDEIVVVAVNRQPDVSYTISSISTSLPEGTYSDELDGLLYGAANSVELSDGESILQSFDLDGGEVCVWSYDQNIVSDTPQIGDVISTMGSAGNIVYIYGNGFGESPTVNFDDAVATVSSAADTLIVTEVPTDATPGYNSITVTNDSEESNEFTYNVLSGDQNQVIFHVDATTEYGENIYVVGSIPELGSWDTDDCSEALMCPDYPEWFLPISVPVDTSFEFKFIKKDSSGNVTWESTSNRALTSSSDETGVMDVYYTWDVE